MTDILEKLTTSDENNEEIDRLFPKCRLRLRSPTEIPTEDLIINFDDDPPSKLKRSDRINNNETGLVACTNTRIIRNRSPKVTRDFDNNVLNCEIATRSKKNSYNNCIPKGNRSMATAAMTNDENNRVSESIPIGPFQNEHSNESISYDDGLHHSKDGRIETAGGREVFSLSRTRLGSKKRYTEEIYHYRQPQEPNTELFGYQNHYPIRGAHTFKMDDKDSRAAKSRLEQWDAGETNVLPNNASPNSQFSHLTHCNSYVNNNNAHAASHRFDHKVHLVLSNAEEQSSRLSQGLQDVGLTNSVCNHTETSFAAVSDENCFLQQRKGTFVYETLLRGTAETVVYDDIGEWETPKVEISPAVQDSGYTNRTGCDVKLSANPDPSGQMFDDLNRFLEKAKITSKLPSNDSGSSPEDENVECSSDECQSSTVIARKIGNLAIAEYEGSPRRYVPRPGHAQLVSSSSTSPICNRYVTAGAVRARIETNVDEVLKQPVTNTKDNGNDSQDDLIQISSNLPDISSDRVKSSCYPSSQQENQDVTQTESNKLTDSSYDDYGISLGDSASIFNKSAYSYAYEESETRKVLEEFYKQDGLVFNKILPEDSEKTDAQGEEFDDLDYKLHRNAGNSYVGRRLAQNYVPENEDSPKKLPSHPSDSFPSPSLSSSSSCQQNLFQMSAAPQTRESTFVVNSTNIPLPLEVSTVESCAVPKAVCTVTAANHVSPAVVKSPPCPTASLPLSQPPIVTLAASPSTSRTENLERHTNTPLTPCASVFKDGTVYNLDVVPNRSCHISPQQELLDFLGGGTTTAAEHDWETISTNPDTEDLGETEVGEQVGQSRNFTLSPETTECDSNDVESEVSVENEGSLRSSSRQCGSMPVLEDGLSSGHSSEAEEDEHLEICDKKDNVVTSVAVGDNASRLSNRLGLTLDLHIKPSISEIPSTMLPPLGYTPTCISTTILSPQQPPPLHSALSTSTNPTWLLMKKQISEIEREIARRTTPTSILPPCLVSPGVAPPSSSVCYNARLPYSGLPGQQLTTSPPPPPAPHPHRLTAIASHPAVSPTTYHPALITDGGYPSDDSQKAPQDEKQDAETATMRATISDSASIGGGSLGNVSSVGTSDKNELVDEAIKEIKQAIRKTKMIPLKSPPMEKPDEGDEPVWVLRHGHLSGSCSSKEALEASAKRKSDKNGDAPDEDPDTDQETDRLLGRQRTDDQGFYDDKEKETTKKKGRSKEVIIHEPAVLIEGVLFRARYLGSTQLVCEGQPTKATRMMQAEEAVSRIKAPEGETQPSTEVDLFISTEKIMVLNTDLKEIMMDHSLRTISYIADIGDLVVLMARRRMMSTPEDPEPKIRRTPKMICHVFESEEAQFIAQSIGQAFQVAYMEFLKANGIEDHSFVREMDYQEVLNSQEIYGDELEMFAKKEMQKEVVVPKMKSEILGVVIVESGWGSMLPTVVIANLSANGAAARCGQLNIGDQIIAINGISLVGLPLSTCQNYIKNARPQTVVKLTVVPCAPVVEVKIKRPDTKYQLGFSVQNGVICSLLRGGIAERGGVRVGHRIIEINGQSVVAVPHERIVNLLATSVGEILMKTMPTSMFRLLTGQETPIYI